MACKGEEYNLLHYLNSGEKRGIDLVPFPSLLKELKDYNPYKNKEKTMEQEVKELRVQLDGLAALTKGLKPIPDCGIDDCKSCVRQNSKEIDKAVDSLYLSKAWLGKVLGELGQENPYKSGYKNKEDIEPTADKAKNLTVNFDGGWGAMNHIERVDLLRQEIDKIISDIRFLKIELSGTVYSSTFISNVTTHLSEARFWLGFELERIKESK